MNFIRQWFNKQVIKALSDNPKKLHAILHEAERRYAVVEEYLAAVDNSAWPSIKDWGQVEPTHHPDGTPVGKYFEQFRQNRRQTK